MSRACYILFLLFVLSFLAVQGQVSTLGRDFWFAFPENQSPTDTSSPSLYICVSAVDSVHGTVTNHRTGWHQTFWLSAGYTAMMAVSAEQAMLEGSDSIFSRALHVETSGKASVSILSMRGGSADACNVLATPALRNEYVIQCYPSPASSPSVKSCGELVVVSLANNTVVDITPSCPTLDGRLAGVTYSVTLRRGESYQVQSAVGGDLSGTRVVSQSCRSIAVFQGNTYARIPDSCATGNTLLDEAVPTAYWGRHFVLTNTPGRRADRCRVTSLYDSCQISLGSNYLATIQSHQTFEFAVPDTDQAFYLETTKPSYVCEYLASTQVGGDTGAPAMVVVNPVEQRVSSMAFYIPPLSQVGKRCINIVAQASGYVGITVDNQEVTSHFHPVAGNPNYVYASIPITDGAHVIRGGSRGFTAHVLALGKNGTNMSFAHSCGAMMSKQNNQININDVWTGLLSDTIHYCQGECSDFTLSLSGSTMDVEWDFADNTPRQQGLSVQHCFDTAGVFMVTARVANDSSDCFGDAGFDSVVVPVWVHRTYLRNSYDTAHVTQLPIQFGGYIFYGAVTNDTIRKTTRFWGCDSIIVYSLFVYNDTVYHQLYDSVCQGSPYRDNGFDLSAESILQNDSSLAHFRRVDSLDVYLLTLTLLNPPKIAFDAVRDENDGYVIYSGQNADFYFWRSSPNDPSLEHQHDSPAVNVSPSEITTYYLLAGYRTIDDHRLDACRSTDSITLQPRRQSTLWIPNTFQPGDGYNGTFHISGTEISFFEIYIYNRQGQLMFHSTSIDDSWDGTCHGLPMPQGAYSYVIRYSDNYTRNAYNRRAGTLTLLR